MKFQNLTLISPILRAVNEAGYTTATEIQNLAIPHILKGKDLIGCAQTGTGKTAAFAIPILQLLQAKPAIQQRIRALVLVPTRELAIQVDENFKTYGKYLHLQHLAIYGGMPQNRQVMVLKKGIDILIATPGRLLDLMQQGYISLSQIEILVLDEADRMLDMGFINDIKKILVKLPTNRQTLFFSATMPTPIRRFSNTILNNSIEVSIAPTSSAAKTVKQFVYFIEKKQKTELLIGLLKDTTIGRSLVFTRTKHGADRLAKQLSRMGIYAAAIHGDKSQNARQKALNDFKNRKVQVLIATDIAARGIDINELAHVVNYEIPNVPETYVHRIGRTGRAGMEGTAISFCDMEERIHLKSVQKLIGFDIPVLQNATMIV